MAEKIRCSNCGKSLGGWPSNSTSSVDPTKRFCDDCRGGKIKK